jgi:hypothetical protein
MLGCVASIWGAPGTREPREKEIKEPISRISLQVSALQALYFFKATPEQLEALGRLARATAPRPQQRKPDEVSERYRKVLTDLRTALVEAKDERIGELTEALKEIQEEDAADLDDAVEVLPAARKKVPEALRLFNARQLAVYLGSFGDDFPEPLERLQAALEDARSLQGDDWAKQRKALTELIGWLVAGLDHEGRAQVTKEAAELLDRAHDLSGEDYKAKKPELEKAARKVVGAVSATAVLRHHLEHDLAELLSNPELPAVVEARLKKLKADQENEAK